MRRIKEQRKKREGKAAQPHKFSKSAPGGAKACIEVI